MLMLGYAEADQAAASRDDHDHRHDIGADKAFSTLREKSRPDTDIEYTVDNGRSIWYYS